MFDLNVVTPEKKVVETLEVESVVVPAHHGELTLLPGHAPLISTLSTGVLRYRAKGAAKDVPMALSWGYLEVSENSVTVLAETAEVGEAIDKQRAERALEQAKKQLSDPQIQPSQIFKFQRKMERAKTRLEVLSN